MTGTPRPRKLGSDRGVSPVEIIPGNATFHCLALLKDGVAGDLVERYCEHASKRRPGLETTRRDWTALSEPRSCTFGTVGQGEWSWHILIDLGRVPAPISAVFGDRIEKHKDPAIRTHGAHAFVFLIESPRTTGVLDGVRSTLELAWAWLDVGATALAFPAGGRVFCAGDLAEIEPGKIETPELCARLLDYVNLGKSPDGRTWLQTRGMAQFQLPDLCCPIAHRKEIESVDILFQSAPPYLIQLGRALHPGETVQIDSRTWRIGGPQDLRSAPVARSRIDDLLVFLRA